MSYRGKSASLDIPKLEVTDNGSCDLNNSNPKSSPPIFHQTPPSVKKLGIKKVWKGRFKGSRESLEGSGVSDDGGEYVPPGRPKQFNKVLQQIRERAMQKRRRSKSTEDTNGKSPVLTAALNEESSSYSPALRVRSVTTLSTTDEECVDGDSLEDVGSYDEVGGGDEADNASDSERKRQAVEHLRYKVDKYREQIRCLQEERDESVKEYLESTEGVHNQRVKTNFEKKNQKTNATIVALQKKLEKYHKALVDLEQNGVSPMTTHSAKESAKEVFRGVKENIRGISGGVRDGVKAGLSGAVSKPLEIANLIKNKFGSSENILAAKGEGEEECEEGDRGTNSETERTNLSPARYNSDDDNSSIASATHLSSSINVPSPRQSADPSPPWFDHEVTDLKESQIRLIAVMDAMKHEISFLAQSLQDERYKSEYLQCQLNDLTSQWNDMTELHQNEIMSLKQELERAEERIECVEYRSAERAGEIEEALDTYVTRITKMEALQQQSQQMVTIDDYFDQSVQARALLSKLLSFILAIFAIILIIFTTLARSIGPFTRTRFRLVVTTIIVCILAFLWSHQDHQYMLLLRSYLKSHLHEPWESLKTKIPILGWIFNTDSLPDSLITGNNHTGTSVR